MLACAGWLEVFSASYIERSQKVIFRWLFEVIGDAMNRHAMTFYEDTICPSGSEGVLTQHKRKVI